MVSDALDRNEIKKRLNTDVELFTYELIDSTNTEARRYAQTEGKTPAAFIAEEQSSGRGRCGRSFFSPKGTGLYLSVLIPEVKKNEICVTAAAAVAVRRAILRVTGLDTGIKWVNDLYLNGKKVSGILAEALSVNGKGFYIVGVGINLCTEDFPDGLTDKACSLGIHGAQNELAAEAVNELLRVFESDYTYIDEYRESSIVLGKEIVYTQNGVEYAAVAEDIDVMGRLHVITSKGDRRVLASGEISLRLQ